MSLDGLLPSKHDFWLYFRTGAPWLRPLTAWVAHTPVTDPVPLILQVWTQGIQVHGGPTRKISLASSYPLPYSYTLHDILTMFSKSLSQRPVSHPQLLQARIQTFATFFLDFTSKASLNIPTATALGQATTVSYLRYFYHPQVVLGPNLPLPQSILHGAT